MQASLISECLDSQKQRKDRMCLVDCSKSERLEKKTFLCLVAI